MRRKFMFDLDSTDQEAWYDQDFDSDSDEEDESGGTGRRDLTGELDAVFTAKLAQAKPDYRVRPGQLTLARSALNTMVGGGVLLAEAPCGLGKSFASLVPLILDQAERQRMAKNQPDGTNMVPPALVLTRTIALQDQLMRKDLPFLHEVMSADRPFTYELLKGRRNYLCQRLVQEYDTMAEGTQPAWWDAVRDWSESTVTGDHSDLPSGIDESAWTSISSGADDCEGRQCSFYGSCWGTIARQRAMRADIIVSNYHVALVNGAQLLGIAGTVVCDEAHELAGVARQMFGKTLSIWGIAKIAKQLKRVEFTWRSDVDRLPCPLPSPEDLREEAKLLYQGALVEMIEDSGAQTLRLHAAGRIQCERLVSMLRDIHRNAVHTKDHGGTRIKRLTRDRIVALGERALTHASLLERANRVDNPDQWVYWLQLSSSGGNPHVVIEARPFVVAPILERALFDRAEGVVLMSATLRSSDGFGFIHREVGPPPDAVELVVPSPFTLPSQAALIVPAYVPMVPKYTRSDERDEDGVGRTSVNEEYRQGVAAAAVELILAMGGRTLCLFTSWDALDSAYGYVKNVRKIPPQVRLLRQRPGEPVQPLVDDFARDELSVLFGVASLWQGVDVPGDSLKGLFIDKIPFPHPGDPTNVAMSEYIDRTYPRNGSRGMAFDLWSLPLATMALQQGMGRLIRSETDTGVIVVADQRLFKYGYGRKIIEACPRFSRFISIPYARQLLPKLFVTGSDPT